MSTHWRRFAGHGATSLVLVMQVLGCGTKEPTGESNGSTAQSGTEAQTSNDGTRSSEGAPSVSEATNSPGFTASDPSSTSALGTTTAVDDETSLSTEPDPSEVSSDPDSTEPSAEPTLDGGSSASSDAGPSEDTSPSSGDETSTSAELPDCEPANEEFDVVGYGAAATGGGSSTPVLVATFAEAVATLDAYRDAFDEGTQQALLVRYTGTFDFSTITDVCAQHTKSAQTLNIKEVENVTFEGAPGSSANFGIKINRAKNVIVRNMTIGLLPGGGDSDAITIEGNGTNGDVEHVWIDHNDLFSSTKDDCDGAGDTEFDGLIDIKNGARYITISYNKLHDHQKTGLLGSSDSDDMDRFVTFHHNWYENVVSRTPLHRFGYVHLYNNYFNRILDSGINVRMGGVALIEANYFSNAANPVTSRYSDEAGYWDLRANHVGENVTWAVTEDTLANAEDWTSTATFPAGELTYQYQPDDASCVKSIVTARAGATLSGD